MLRLPQSGGRVHRAAADVPVGTVDYNGGYPAVGGIVIARPEANVAQVIADHYARQ